MTKAAEPGIALLNSFISPWKCTVGKPSFVAFENLNGLGVGER
jgi:hypothetical protein